MSILATEIKWFNPVSISDTVAANNGGRHSQTQNVSNVKNNLFPDVSYAQRAAGAEHWRKTFVMVKNSENLSFVDPKISIEKGTPGDSYVLIYPGTWVDTGATRTGRPYGYGTLAGAVSAAATEIVVTTEVDFSAMVDKPFQDGDVIRIDARTDVTQTGLSEYAEIDALLYDGNEITITLAAPLVNGYAAGVHVASVIEPGTFAASVADKSTTGGVTYDSESYPIVVPQIGAVYQTWTITVTNYSNGSLSVAGDTLGVIGTGATGVNLSPSNPYGGNYFTLPSGGWGGTMANGDTLVFTTIPAGCGLWYKRIIPAGSVAISTDSVAVCLEGETA